MKKMLLAVLLSANAFAEEEAAKFAYHCEWQEGQVKKWEIHHVNIANNIVDGKMAVIDENYISFVKDNVEHKIDRKSGAMEKRALKPVAGGQQTDIRECKKVAPLPFDVVVQ